MLFPDFLFRLTPRDEQVTPIETIDTQMGDNGMVLKQGFTNPYTVPLGRVLILQSVSLIANPAGADWCTASTLYIDYGGRSNIIYSQSFQKDVSIQKISGGLAVPLYIPQNQTLTGINFYGLGTAGATNFLYLSGILIPRGNFAI